MKKVYVIIVIIFQLQMTNKTKLKEIALTTNDYGFSKNRSNI